ncbi:unnamed protein product [Spodoptera littoralis]|uniref:Uncharacterized protein n=1 Tax=Spodoptera littoralis TaxID=7109 RepID=A0A9P0HV91_SPOLI|nr:unnamed protein product [Spodoptera littoralis]CAH1635021.1 unnamed protein product [Spodoptera littoralis]
MMPSQTKGQKQKQSKASSIWKTTLLSRILTEVLDKAVSVDPVISCPDVNGNWDCSVFVTATSNETFGLLRYTTLALIPTPKRKLIPFRHQHRRYPTILKIRKCFEISICITIFAQFRRRAQTITFIGFGSDMI